MTQLHIGCKTSVQRNFEPRANYPDV